MTEAEILVDVIVHGLQEKKGKEIVTLDLRDMPGSICDFFVICEGNSPKQVEALSDSVWEEGVKQLKEKPMGIDGEREAQWIAMDYGTVILHIFLPELRKYYDLDGLWANAKKIEIPNVL